MSTVFEALTSTFQSKKVWWRVAQAYFMGHHFTEHQLDSYNLFMREKIQTIIKNSEFEYKKDSSTFIVNFDNVYISKPDFTEPNGTTKLKPQECRQRNLSYMCKVYIDITRSEINSEGKIIATQVHSNIFVGAMPCMLLSEFCHLSKKDKSGMIKNLECPLDPGGYFIIGGTEKVLMSQDRMAHNEIFVFQSKEKDTIKIPLPGTDKNRSLPCGWSAEVRSYSSTSEPNITTTYIRFSEQQLDKGEDQRLYVEIPNLKCPVPWPIVFMALGVCDKDEMISYVCNKDDIPIISLLIPSLECPPIFNQEDALNFLSEQVLVTQKEQRLPALKKILYDKLFQNVEQMHIKRFYFGHMTYQLLATVCGRRNQDDRDHYGKKRVETAGNLINNLFKGVWKRVLRDAKNQLEKKRINLEQVMYAKFTNHIKPPFATGNWTAIKTQNKAAKVGISQVVNKHNYISTISCLRRVITPSDKNSKIIKPRHLHNSQWYYICPAETPEGQATGLIKNLSMLTIISLGTSEEPILDWCKINSDIVQLINDIEINTDIIHNQTKVFINGCWIGLTTQAEKLVNTLRNLRRQGKINYEISISHTLEGVRIYTDDGRVLAPFFIVKNGKLPKLPNGDFNWMDLFNSGIIEYLDPCELETLYHSHSPWELSKEHTHAMIHPCFMLGVSAATIPFPDHNQSPRNIYQSSMGKQALGVFANNFLHRYDTNAHILCYPQRPLVNTMTMKMIGAEELPSGQNLIVAVMSASYNQEDSVVINRMTLDNGALRSICYSTYSESNHRKGTTHEEIIRPEELNVKETRLKGYEKLDIDGLSKENTPLAKRDVVIAKVNSSSDMVKDTSIVIKTNGMEEDAVIESNGVYIVKNGSAVVDKSLLTSNEDYCRTAKVRIRQMRVPEIGDKVACTLEDHQVLTKNRRWIQINELTMDDEVAILSENQELKYEKPSKIHVYNYTGKMYNVKSQQVELCVTPEHKMYVRRRNHKEYELIPAENIFGKRVNYKKNANWLTDDCVKIPYLPMHISSVDSFLVFFGIWMAEGCVTNNCIDIAAYKQRVKDALKKCCSEMNININIYSDKTQKDSRYRITDKKLVRFMSIYSVGATKKSLPDWCFNLSERQSKILLESMMLGDGYKTKSSGCYHYYTSSKQLADDVVILALHSGYSANSNMRIPAGNSVWLEREQRYITSTADAYDITIVRCKNEPQINHGHVNSQNGQSEEWINYSGKVYCCTVSSGIFYVRKNGKPVWTGNSRAAQKGIIGMIVAPEDMPYSKKTGMSPDLIMNPNAFPSRMTVGQALETLVGKACALNGTFVDCSPFNPDFNAQVVFEELEKYGFNRHGYEIMINGATGEEMKCEIFMGPTYYQRLKHMVQDKIHSRNQDGPRETLTRQPVEGRKRGGGFRMGEMETWCGISHGASLFLIDRLVNNSDGYEMYVCNNCGNTAIATLTTKRFECKVCQQNTAISKIRIPYAFKLLQQELMAMGMGIWYQIDTKKTLLPAITPSH